MDTRSSLSESVFPSFGSRRLGGDKYELRTHVRVMDEDGLYYLRLIVKTVDASIIGVDGCIEVFCRDCYVALFQRVLKDAVVNGDRMYYLDRNQVSEGERVWRRYEYGIGDYKK